MPSLPLLQTPPDPDAWHQVRAPGGYEGWFFDAEDFSAGMRIVGFIGEGCQIEGDYQAKYQSYRKHPIKNAPPTPREFPGFEFVVLKAGQLVAAGGSSGGVPLSASIDRLAIQLSDNRLIGEGNVFHLHLGDEKNGVKLVFSPVCSPAARFSITPKLLGENHRWSMVPFCRVSGSLLLGGGETAFVGGGCLEHRLGTAPIGTAIKRGVTGCRLSDDRALLFHALQPRNKRGDGEAELIELSESGAKTLAASAAVHWPLLARHPRSLHFDAHLRMDHPRRLTSAGFVAYDVLPRGTASTFCRELI